MKCLFNVRQGNVDVLKAKAVVDLEKSPGDFFGDVTKENIEFDVLDTKIENPLEKFKEALPRAVLSLNSASRVPVFDCEL